MGFEIDRFESPVDPDFVCRLCGKVLEDPLTTPCGHVFCSACVIPWVDTQNSCPVKCQRMSTKELNHVLPMKNLILKLDIRCDNYLKGCKGVVKLQHLSDHAEICDFSSVKCRNKGCNAVLALKDVDSHLHDKCDYRPIEVCKNGCGLMLTLREKLERHSCKDALRTQNCVLQGKLNSLERELRWQTLRSNNRERSLLAQLSAVHCELQMTALRYQKKLTAYKARIDALSSSWATVSKGEETRRLTVTLHRSSGPLGFNITGGRSCAWSEARGDFKDGIFVSKITDDGPADRGGLQTYDRIMKVNGKDLSLATHDEAVEAFCKTRGLIEVEVMRRAVPATHLHISTSPPSDTRRMDASTQTDGLLEGNETVVNFASSTTSSAMTILDKCKCLLSASREEGCVSGWGSFSAGDSWEGRLKGPGQLELHHQEVDLQRMTTQDKMALTLNCKTDDEEETGIYVSEDDGQLEKDETILLDDLLIDMLEHHRAVQFSGCMLYQRGHEEKDSGVGRTDESTRNDESSEPENPGDQPCSSSDPPLGSSLGVGASRRTRGGSLLSFKGVEFPSRAEPALERESSWELLELKRWVSEPTPFAILGASAACRGRPIRSDWEERPLREYGARPGRTNDGGETERRQRYGTAAGTPEQTDKESSSAYNTGGSSASSSPALQLDTTLSRGTDKTGAITHKPILACSKQTSLIQETVPTETESPSEGSETANQVKGDGHLGRSVLASPLLSPYSHVHIPAHARHYGSYMQLVQRRVAVEYTCSDLSEVSRRPRGSPADRAAKPGRRENVRRNGARHVTRWPAREELLRERALRLRQERHGTTTEEEAVSELKAGRYWSREERRRHVARAREQRLHREVARQRLPGQQDGREEDEREPDILQLSHKMMMKMRKKKIFDNWMTIQELLTHGVKSPEGTRLYSPLLTVTTV